MNDIHLNPNLTTLDKVGGVVIVVFAGIMLSLAILNILNSYFRQKHGTRCFWCKKFWVGRGCGCIQRSGRVGSDKGGGSEPWKRLSFEEKAFHMAKFNHRKYLEARRQGMRGSMWCYQSRREAYLSALRFYKESQGVPK